MIKRQRFFRGLGITLATVLAVVGSIRFWYTHRPQPLDEERPLFEGITYRRWSVHAPRPLVLHKITVDLTAPGIGFAVTPGDPGQDLPYKARLTTQFLKESGVQVAVNADFFYPWYSTAPWAYYPHIGDRTRAEGDAISHGTVLCRRPADRPELTTLHLSHDNHIRIGGSGPEENAIGGHVLELTKTPPGPPELQPCLAAGVDKTGKRLFFLLIDGRQPGYSEGVTRPELAEFMRQQGAVQTIQLDGGGSATMAVAGADGKPHILNCPIDNHIPGRERPVANHLGIFARSLPRRK